MIAAQSALTAMLIVASGQAHAAACLTPGDARVLLSVALPDAIEGLSTRCAGVLPPDAFLRTDAAALADRYRREAQVDPARARKAIEAASGQDLSFLADDDSVTRLAHEFVGKAIAKRLSTRDCSTVDSMIALAAPLRADSMAEAVLLGLQLAGPDAAPGLAICRPGDEGPNQGKSGR
jgi:hypothetical protein